MKIKTDNRGFVWEKPAPVFWLSLPPNFLSFCWLLSVAFEKLTFQKVVTYHLFEWKISVVQQDNLYLQQNYEKNFLVTNIGWTCGDGKVATFWQLLKECNSLTKFGQNWAFLSTVRTTSRYYAKRTANLEFFQCVNNKFVDSLKNNGTKYLLICVHWPKQICNSKAVVGFATAKRHCADWVPLTITTFCFKNKQVATLSFQTHTFSLPTTPVRFMQSLP